MCDDKDAVASHQFSLQTGCMNRQLSYFPFARLRCQSRWLKLAKPPLAPEPRCCQPLIMRDICSMRAEPMNLLGLKSGDPVCRPIGFRCFPAFATRRLRCRT
jgi:hypothetical protein